MRAAIDRLRWSIAAVAVELKLIGHDTWGECYNKVESLILPPSLLLAKWAKSSSRGGSWRSAAIGTRSTILSWLEDGQ